LDPGDRLFPPRVTERLRTRRFGRRIYYYPETDSTNRVAVGLIARGEVEGALVVADFQTAGRGRLGRAWSSPPGRDLLFTLVLRPGETAAALLPVTLVLASAIASCLSDLLRVEVGVKWPNDVVTAGGKIGGILAEKPARTGGAGAGALAVGIGLNVNSERDDFPAAYRDRAVSCRTVTGTEHDRADVLCRVLGVMEDRYADFCNRGFAKLRGRYEARLFMRGKRVSFERGGETVSGVVEGVAEDGALRVAPGRSGGASMLLYGEEVTPLS
jgi:BirA family biotin operon repressor/biotin-[acetyl-CoA-carboxylase] ligase